MDHIPLVTASVKFRNQFPKVSRRHIDDLENIYGIPADLHMNLEEYLGTNKLFDRTKTLSLKIIKTSKNKNE